MNDNGDSIYEPFLPGVKAAMKKIKDLTPLLDEDIENLRRFVDTFVIVDLSDPDVKAIVSEVNIHHHTNACRSKGTKCRFNYPKFPSPETINVSHTLL